MRNPRTPILQSSVNAHLTRLLLFLRWHLILNVSYERDPHLRSVISAQHITDKVRLDLHLNLKAGSVMGPGTREPTPIDRGASNLPSPGTPGGRHTKYWRTIARPEPAHHREAPQSPPRGCLQR